MKKLSNANFSELESFGWLGVGLYFAIVYLSLLIRNIVATRLGFGGILRDFWIANLSDSVTVKEF